MDEAHLERTERFDALFGAFGQDIVAYCGWRSDSASDAQDAVAEVFLTAWRRLDELPEGNAARIWLYATARRVIANQRRAARRRLALRERLMRERDADAAHVAFAASSSDQIVHEALGRIRSRDREVLLLAEWERLTPAEIAEILGCLTVTARGRLHRARFRFRVAFEELVSDAGTRKDIDKEDERVEIRQLQSARTRQPAV